MKTVEKINEMLPIWETLRKIVGASDNDSDMSIAIHGVDIQNLSETDWEIGALYNKTNGRAFAKANHKTIKGITLFD